MYIKGSCPEIAKIKIKIFVETFNRLPRNSEGREETNLRASWNYHSRKDRHFYNEVMLLLEYEARTELMERQVGSQKSKRTKALIEENKKRLWKRHKPIK